MKKIAILGSTGSIGTQTLEVARENGDLQITALAAGNNIELLEKQIRENAHKLLTPQARKAAIAAGRAVDVSADEFEG